MYNVLSILAFVFVALFVFPFEFHEPVTFEILMSDMSESIETSVNNINSDSISETIDKVDLESIENFIEDLQG